MLVGFAAFLDLYSTQPLLPMLARTFRGEQLCRQPDGHGADDCGRADGSVRRAARRSVGLRNVIVGSALALAAATLLAGTASTLRQLIAWRFVQGAVTPGLFASAVAYIHEEWPASRTGRVTAAYVSGTVIGGVTGRLLGGVVANDVGWSSSFVVLGVIGCVVAAALWLWLPAEHRRQSDVPSAGGSWAHLFHRQLLATYAVGFCMLCTQLAMFTYVPFLLAAPPFSLSTKALGLLVSDVSHGRGRDALRRARHRRVRSSSGAGRAPSGCARPAPC